MAHPKSDKKRSSPNDNGPQPAKRHSAVLADLPIAADARAMKGLCPKVYFGPAKHSVLDLDPKVFELARILMAVSGDEPPRLDIPAEQVQIEEHEEVPWNVTLDYGMVAIMQKHGFEGTFRYVLRGLTILGEGSEVKIDPLADKHISRLLVDLPLANQGGLIHAYCDGRTASFEFSVFHRSRVALNFLHWFHGTSVSMMPLYRGIRAMLLYDVIPERISLPLKILRGSDRMCNLEAVVQNLVQMETFQRLHPKTSFLPLVRILIHIYKPLKDATTAPCYDLYYQVVDSYRLRLQQALNSYSSNAVLAQIREEGMELISSFGGEQAMQNLLGESYVAELVRKISSLGCQ